MILHMYRWKYGRFQTVYMCFETSPAACGVKSGGFYSVRRTPPTAAKVAGWKFLIEHDCEGRATASLVVALLLQRNFLHLVAIATLTCSFASN